MQDNFWTSRGGFHGHRARRGDMAPIILGLLKEKPMHGYEIISSLENKSHGMWRPSAGSVYPNLQMLEEQELVSSSEDDGKKIYSLTDKGLEAAEHAEASFEERWQAREAHGAAFRELKPTFFEIMGLLKDVAAQNSEEKTIQAKQILTETRSKLETLANDK